MTAPVSAIVPLAVSDRDTGAFVPVAGHALVLRVVRALLDVVSAPGHIVVGAAQSLVDDIRRMLDENNLSGVAVAAAADLGNRADCLAAGCEYLRAQDVSAVVLVHDLEQPLVHTDVCDRVIAQLRDGSAVVMPVLPVTDSVKVVDDHGTVLTTLDRSTLQIVQYPRGFALETLAQLLARCGSDVRDELDEAIRRVPVTTVAGDGGLFTVELPRDAEFVEAVIASRRPLDS